MNNNPFVSATYRSIWLNHFNSGKPGKTFDTLPGLAFIKHPYLPFYYNTGKTHTKGISYELTDIGTPFPEGRVLVIYDVPGYFRQPDADLPKNTGLYRIRQYPGFVIDLDQYADFNSYMSAMFSKNTRTKMNKFRKRLDLCFDITYTMHWGDISRDHYDYLFEEFRMLLEKRFSGKQITNNNLDPAEWEFYKAVAYPMILEKKAGLYVVYDRGQPIGITLNYLSDTTIFDAITVFDTDYTKFHLGAVMLSHLIEWSMAQQLKIFDFSKGFFDYKQRWASRSYDFEYHILYDSASPSARALAASLKKFYSNKQLLRDKKLNEKLHRLTYRLRSSKNTAAAPETCAYTFAPLDNESQKKSLLQYNKQHLDDPLLKYVVFEFLYLNNECFNDLQIFVGNGNFNYVLSGKSKEVGVVIAS